MWLASLRPGAEVHRAWISLIEHLGHVTAARQGGMVERLALKTLDRIPGRISSNQRVEGNTFHLSITGFREVSYINKKAPRDRSRRGLWDSE